jgi:hypothetical protein
VFRRKYQLPGLILKKAVHKDHSFGIKIYLYSKISIPSNNCCLYLIRYRIIPSAAGYRNNSTSTGLADSSFVLPKVKQKTGSHSIGNENVGFTKGQVINEKNL